MDNKAVHTDKKPEAHVLERHRLSVCDIRHPQAVQIQREILIEGERQERIIDRARRDRYLLLAKLPPVGERTDADIEGVQLLSLVIADLKDKKHRLMTQLYQALRDLTAVNVVEVNNIIPTAGRSVIARWIIGDNTYDADLGANYGSLGTSNTAVANGDTQLTAETYRKARSSESQVTNVATLSNFYSAGEVTGTFEEAGWHIAGTATANSGQLLSHFLTGTTVKASDETLTVESTLTIS